MPNEIKEIRRDAGLITVLAEQARHKAVKPEDAKQAADIIAELCKDNSPESRYKIAQIMAYTLTELQNTAVNFLDTIADIKTVGYNDRPVFNMKTGGIKAYIQARGATTARSYVSERQVTMNTEFIAARPAINIVDLKAGRVNMAELLTEANREMTNKKMMRVEACLHDAIDDFSSPFYATGSGVVKATLDAQIAYFARLGPVTLAGDRAAVSQLAPLVGMAMNSGTDVFTQRTEGMVDEYNQNGFIGRYNGCDVMAFANGYKEGTMTPILDPNWIYIIPGGMNGDARNLKIANGATVDSIESQNIDD